MIINDVLRSTFLTFYCRTIKTGVVDYTKVVWSKKKLTEVSLNYRCHTILTRNVEVCFALWHFYQTQVWPIKRRETRYYSALLEEVKEETFSNILGSSGNSFSTRLWLIWFHLAHLSPFSVFVQSSTDFSFTVPTYSVTWKMVLH